LLIGDLSSVGATRGMPIGIHTVDLPVATGRSLLHVFLSKWHFIC